MIGEAGAALLLGGCVAGVGFLAGFRREVGLLSAGMLFAAFLLFTIGMLAGNELAAIAAVNNWHYVNYGRPAPLGELYRYAPNAFNALIAGGLSLCVYALYLLSKICEKRGTSLWDVVWGVRP